MLCNEGKYTPKIGDVIIGSWNRHAYQAVRPLGNGANGQVWLVRKHGKNFAMKLGTDSHGLALEYRLLKQMQQAAPHTDTAVRDLRLGPFVYELDDFNTENKETVFFYTMEYIEGIPLGRYISSKGKRRIPAVISRLLQFLQQLHELGYAFGDIKADNVLVNPMTGIVRLVDFGGATRFGESIRQYTEWNDRAFWGAGLRKADPAYDLFAVGMMLAQLLGAGQLKADAGQLKADERDVNKIGLRLRQINDNLPWMGLLEKAWRVEYKTASQMLKDVTAIKQLVLQQSDKSNSVFNKMHKGLVREWDWSDWTVIGSAVVCLFIFLRLLMVQ